jgi:hypothetical protein
LLLVMKDKAYTMQSIVRASAHRPAVYKEILEDAIPASAGMTFSVMLSFALAVEF